MNQNLDCLIEILKQVNLLQQQLQQNLKSKKQLVNGAKDNLLNPFLSYSLIYQLQSTIQNFKTQVYQSNQRQYLVLVDAEANPNIHLQLLNLINLILSDWLTEQSSRFNQNNQKILQQYNQLKFDLSTIDLNPEFLEEKALLILPQTELSHLYEEAILTDLNRLDCGRKNTNKLIYRFSLVLFISAVLYYSTGLIIGLMPLLIQGLNLILTRETHKIKIEQKTEILRRNLEQKYQHLARLAVNQASKQLVELIEQQHQQYEQNLEQFKHKLNQQIQSAKQIKQEQNQYLKAYNRIQNKYLSKIKANLD